MRFVAQIGEGGMGQVFRATDTKLKRQVAIKILPPSLAADHDRLARFQREAEILASLNHPHIAGIHGLTDSDGVSALGRESGVNLATPGSCRSVQSGMRTSWHAAMVWPSMVLAAILMTASVLTVTLAAAQ
jgi:serine/threonine protein kinase